MAGPIVSIMCTDGHFIVVDAPLTRTMFNVVGLAERSVSCTQLEDIYTCRICGLCPRNWGMKVSGAAQHLGRCARDGESYRFDVGTGFFTQNKNVEDIPASTVTPPTEPCVVVPTGIICLEGKTGIPEGKAVEADWITPEILEAIWLGAYYNMTCIIHEAMMTHLREAISEGYTGASMTASTIRELHGIDDRLSDKWDRFRTTYMARMSHRYKITMVKSIAKDVTPDGVVAIRLVPIRFV
jgi:hypothetical protein